LPEEGKLTEKKPGRQSAISEHVNVLGVLDQVLNAKVELAVGEVIGVSRELSGQLANAINSGPSSQWSHQDLQLYLPKDYPQIGQRPAGY